MAESSKCSVILDHGGPIVLWCLQGPGEHTAGEPRRGLVLDTAFCRNPNCRFAHITAVAVVDGGGGVERDGADAARSRIGVSVDLDTWKLEFPPATEERPRNPDLEKRLEELIDSGGDHLRKALEKRWRCAHGVSRDAWRRKDWSWWEPGAMVSWREVHPDDPDFLIDSGDETLWAEDFYCITPKCSCREVKVHISRVSGEMDGYDGAIRVDLRRWKVSGEDDSSRLSPQQEHLWEVWNRSDPGIRKEMNRRRKQMLRLGPEIVNLSGRVRAPVVEKKKKAERRVGRNEPCPCGSGRKYKKCCLSK